MSLLQLAARYKKPLIVAELIFFLLFAAELIYLRKMSTVELSGATAVAVLIPPFGVWLCFFPLCFLAWFQNDEPDFFRSAKLVFFWLLLLGSAAIWFNIIRMSVGKGL